MIMAGTKLVVADNSGAKVIECITALGHTRDNKAYVGDLVSASVKVAIPRAHVKKKEVVKALIIRTRKAIRREDGSYIRFDDNAAVILDEDMNPRGTRIFGPVPREIRKNYPKIVSMALDVL